MDIGDILGNSLLFKSKLGIGERAYKWCGIKNNLPNVLDAIGFGRDAGTFVQSATVAKMIGTKTGALSFLGLGTPVTPLLYVALAAVGSSAIYYGILTHKRNASDDHLIIIPKFINTPLELLAVSLFELIAPLLYKVAICDGEYHRSEQQVISNYFITNWGFSKEYVEKSLDIISQQIQADDSLEKMIKPFLKYIDENSDCNREAIGKDILKVFREIAEADGELKPEEEKFLSDAEIFISGKKFDIKSAIETISNLFKRK